MTDLICESATAPQNSSGSRFDQIAAELFPKFSRSRIQSWIKEGNLTLNGRVVKPNTKVSGGEKLCLNVEVLPEGEWTAEDIPFNVLYEDDGLIVVDKPAGLVVHPAAGNWSGTLLNGLIFRYPELTSVPRAGIVHRLDKDTSGLMVVARTIESQVALVEQLQSRTVKRQYLALITNVSKIAQSGTVDEPIGRHPSQRTKMAVVPNGKEARTHYQKLREYGSYGLIKLDLDTGRTHQIRVHMAHKGCSLVGDPVYGFSYSSAERNRKPALAAVFDFPRQALHAKKLGLLHPVTGEYMEWQTALPDDFENLMNLLKDVS